MTIAFSTYGANAVLNGTAMPATLYLKPHVGNPGPAGANNAAAETTRKSFTRTTATIGAISNPATVTWPTVPTTETWTHWSAWDAATAGNCWAVGTFVTPVSAVIGASVQIAIGDLDLSLPIWS